MGRLTDNDHHFGPFTFAKSSWNPWRVVLSSGDDDEDKGCTLTVYAFGGIACVRLPQIIKPWRQWVDTSKHSWSTNPAGGYWDSHAREYGFSLHEGFLNVFLGAQTHDSTTTQSWSKFLPWTQWHHHRFSLHGLEGELLREWVEPRRRAGRVSFFDEQYAFEKTMPKVVFEIFDFDGQRVRATTHIEQREWTFGEGWFQWLRFFRRNKVHRSLDIEFDKEVGPEKGSWKGGTMGTGIEMLPGERHEEAFRRFCEGDHHSKSGRYMVTFGGKVETP